MSEYAYAATLAKKVLGNPSIDPDSDAAVLSRCLLRAHELLDRVHEHVCSLRCPSTGNAGTPIPHGDDCNSITYMIGKQR